MRRSWSSALFAICVCILAHAEARAQLNDSCTVSAYNRSAPVQADGVWVLPNVPANLGQVRVRATCVENGQVRSGQSPLLSIPPDGVITVDQIDFSSVVAIPVSLALETPATLLTGIGQTAQLIALATYPDGSTADVTAADKGTGYRTSNATIAAVDAGGLVTAHASGVALLSAVHEGTLAVLRIQVVASGDSDGDGLPDDWELAHGLDPNNPLDALEDPDHDGLSTIDEYRLGTDPFMADTDGDGLSDGDEVNRYHTNPLLADTDGDGIWDGLEVRTGSDPLDPASFNLAAALGGIEVTPAVSVLVFNTILGEASRQLVVIGHLIDGHDLDITAHRYGTGFASSDLRIASFGAGDGRIYAGQDGAATITATNGTFSASASVQVQTFAPRALSYVHIPGFANNVAVAGNYAYVAAGATGLQVVDVSDLAHPFVAGSVDTPGNANDVRIVGSLAYVADGDYGLEVVDVSSPPSPRIVGRVRTAGVAADLTVVGGYAYVADEQGLSVVDVRQPAHPVLLGSVPTSGRARGVEVAGNLAVVAISDGGVEVVDVTDPANPFVTGATETRANGLSSAADVAVRGQLAFVADGADKVLGGLRVLDLRSPDNPVVTGTTEDAFGLTSVALDRNFALASDYLFANAVPIFDIGSGVPQFRGFLDFSGPPSFRDDQGNGLAVRDGVVFLAANACCVVADDGVTWDSGLHIGRYALFGDDAGIPPTIRLTAPAPGDSAGERTRLTLKAEASDDVRVESVRFLVNGQPVFTAFGPPYEYSLTVPAGAELRIGAVATDGGGNQTAAQEVRIPIVANTAPTVALLAPVAGQSVVEGTTLTLAAEASDDQAVTKVELYVNAGLVATLTDPPYLASYPVPPGATQLSVTAKSYDDAGASPPSAPVVVNVQPDLPPFATIVAPSVGTGVEEESTVTVVAGVADDVGIGFVTFFVNGVAVRSLGSPPFEITLQAPAAGGPFRVHVEVSDSVGHRTTSPELLIPVLPDPGTTVTGRVVDLAGSPVPGATVEVHTPLESVAGTTSTDGTFAVSGVRTNHGDISLNVLGEVAGCGVAAAFGPLAPVPGAATDVGTLVALTPANATTTVTGVVVDANGTPVPGAVVRAYSEDMTAFGETRSGDDGSFTVPDLSVRAWGVYASVSAGSGPSALHTEVFRRLPDTSPGGWTDLGNLELAFSPEPAPLVNQVSGRVVDRNGAPVPGAVVVVRANRDAYPGTTAADGTFSIPVPASDAFGIQFQVGASARLDCIFSVGPVYQFPFFDPSGATDVGTLVLGLDPGPAKPF